jgi:hypothetical protein
VTFRQRRGGYLALVLLIGLVGGLAMAAARRALSSFAAFRASTNPSDLTVQLLDPRAYDPYVVSAVSDVAHVKRVERYTFIQISPLGPDGGPTIPPQLSPLGSIDGLGFHEDRTAVTQGRMANPPPDHVEGKPSGAAASPGPHSTRGRKPDRIRPADYHRTRYRQKPDAEASGFLPRFLHPPPPWGR